jgi:hypothetical protein
MKSARAVKDEKALDLVPATAQEEVEHRHATGYPKDQKQRGTGAPKEDPHRSKTLQWTGQWKGAAAG